MGRELFTAEGGDISRVVDEEEEMLVLNATGNLEGKVVVYKVVSLLFSPLPTV